MLSINDEYSAKYERYMQSDYGSLPVQVILLI